MKNVAVADCETDPFKLGRVPKPFIWGFYDGEHYEQFYSTVEFIRYIYDKEIILYAHNGGKFDWHFILDYIDIFEKIKIINGRIAKFKIGECEFRDSFNILPTALVAFKKDEFDYSILEPDKRNIPANKKKIEKYLYHDCLYLYQYVTEFIDRFGMNLTLAGTALKQWELISDRKAPNDDGGVLYDLFKSYYYGGRCQSFEHGIINDDFMMVDINSAYPYAMLSKHPFSITYSSDYNKIRLVDAKIVGQGFYKISALSMGALPYRGKDNSLYFPDDNIERLFYVTGWELLAAIDTGAINNDAIISEQYHFTEHIDFSDYIHHFYNERKIAKQNNDKATNIFCKLLMNSLYGKFGSNPDDYKNFMLLDGCFFDENGIYKDIKTEGKAEIITEWHYSGDFGSHVLGAKKLYDAEKRFFNIATAASITGYVRAFMWRALSQCERPLYCDTDSIAAINIDNVPNGFGKELGQWEKEGEFSRGAFCGRKLYAMEYNKNYHKEGGYKIASKGVRLNSDEIFRIAKGEIICYQSDVPVFSVHKAPYFQPRTVKLNQKKLIE
jgi:hypothetical protein